MINTWHPYTNKSVFVGAMGFPTGHQRTWKESCPPMQHVIGRETLFLSVDTEVIHVSVLDQSLEPLENTNSDSHQQRRKPLWKFRSQRMQHTFGANKNEFGHPGVGCGSYFKCEDNTKFKGTPIIKEIWHHHRIMIIFQWPNPQTWRSTTSTKAFRIAVVRKFIELQEKLEKTQKDNSNKTVKTMYEQNKKFNNETETVKGIK